MDTLDFLRKVLPDNGWYVIVTIDENRTAQSFYQKIEELEAKLLALDSGGHNTYFAISSFAEQGNRKQANVRATKVLIADIDCGPDKPYADQSAGAVALQNFLKQSGLPAPMILSSGRGLHCYWVLDRELPPGEWGALASALKRKAAELGFEADPARTADSASVLRPLGTHNPKNGAVVSLLRDSPAVDADKLKNILTVNTIQQSAPVARSTLLDNLQVKTEFPLGKADVIEDGCAQINWGYNNQKGVAEPIWYSMLGVAAYCDNPEETAHRWSSQHPDYDEYKTIRKMEQWKSRMSGPATCAHFAQLDPKKCATCPFKDRVKTPLQLGAEYERKEASDVPEGVKVPELPPGYARTTAGIVVTLKGVEVPVCRFDVIPVSYGKDESLGYEVVRFLWKRPHEGWQEVVLRNAYLADGHREFPTAMADVGIMLNNAKQTQAFQTMLRSYMEELKAATSMTNLRSTMGWKRDFKEFVLGETIYTREADGSVSDKTSRLAAYSQKVTEQLYGKMGKLEDWVNFSKLLDKMDMRPHKFAIGVALSTVLYPFTGIKGVTLSLYGPTGSGKTLTQTMQQSIYGDPTKLHWGASFTLPSLFARMGLYNCLPFTIDEQTLMKAEQIPEFIYWVEQGRDRARLNRDASERQANTWQTAVTISTNRSIAAQLQYGVAGAAQQARLLELFVKPVPAFKVSDVGRRMHEFLCGNFGTVGEIWLKDLVARGPDGVKALIAEGRSEFKKEFNFGFTGEERFHEHIITLSDMALRHATRLGIIGFDWRDGTQEALDQLAGIRRTAKFTTFDAIDIIAEYLNETIRGHVTVTHTDTEKMPGVDQMHLPRDPVRVRFETYRKTPQDRFDRGVLMLDRVHFRSWLQDKGGDFKAFSEELRALQIDATPTSGKAVLTRDTPLKNGQVYVVGVNLGHPRLRHLLNVDEDRAVQDLALGQMKLIDGGKTS